MTPPDIFEQSQSEQVDHTRIQVMTLPALSFSVSLRVAVAALDGANESACLGLSKVG